MPRAVRFHQHGTPDVLQIEEIDVPSPAPGEVVIAVKAIGLNRSETMIRTGRHIETAVLPSRLGYEAAGTVHAVGEGVTGIAIGDAVSVIPPPSVTRWGCYSDMVVVPAAHVVQHPAHLSWEEAAAVWMANITAYGGLIDIGCLTKGEFVLISAGSSSVGLASIQIANMIGAIPIVTTRTSAKRQQLLDAGAAYVIVTDEEDLAESIDALTGGKGVRVIFDPIAGDSIASLARAVAPFGIIILYGALDSSSPSLPLQPLVAKGVAIRGYTFKEIVLDADRRARARTFILEGLRSGALRPIIDQVFAFQDIVNAHYYLESNAQFGKIVAIL